MQAKQIDILAPYRTLPISYLVRTANQFTCDIYIQGDAAKINVKDYEAMQTGLQPLGVTEERRFYGFGACSEFSNDGL